MGCQENYFRSVRWQNINDNKILSFRVDTSKNKNIDHDMELKNLCYYVNTGYIWNQPRLFTPKIQQYQVH